MRRPGEISVPFARTSKRLAKTAEPHPAIASLCSLARLRLPQFPKLRLFWGFGRSEQRPLTQFLPLCLSVLYPAALAPQRKSEFSSLVLRALFTGGCVSLMNACIAGNAWEFGDGKSRVLGSRPGVMKVLGEGNVAEADFGSFT